MIINDFGMNWDRYRAVFDVVKDVEEDNLSFGPPLVFVDVGHDFFDGGQGFLQFDVIAVAFGRLLQ